MAAPGMRVATALSVGMHVLMYSPYVIFAVPAATSAEPTPVLAMSALIAALNAPTCGGVSERPPIRSGRPKR